MVMLYQWYNDLRRDSNLSEKEFDELITDICQIKDLEILELEVKICFQFFNLYR